MTEPNHTPKFTIAHYTVVKTDQYLVYIAQLDLHQFTKMINIFRVEAPNPSIFKN